MTDQPDLAIVIKDSPTFALGPGLILAVILRQLALTPFFCLRSGSKVMLELRLRPLACLLMLPAGGGAERP